MSFNKIKPVAYRHWMIDEEFAEDSCWEYFDAPTGEDCKECIPLYTHPAKEPAKQRYDDCMKDCDEPNPIERLRFFLSCALTGQDWLDVEPFIDAITHPAKTLTDEEIEEFSYAFQLWQLHNPDKALEGIMDFARTILRKTQKIG